MTLLKGNDYKEINVALLSLEADIKNKITNLDTNVIDRQLAEINSRIDKINAGGNNSSAEINDVRTEIENINSKLNANSTKIASIEQKLSDIFLAKNKVTDFNTTTASGIYYWVNDAANKPSDYGVLLVNKYDSGSASIWINQIAYGTNTKIYFRQNINSGKWSKWKAVAFDGEITAHKVANALTVNGKTYDGSSAVDAGVQTVANGGTGVTTQADINKAFIGNLGAVSSDVTDGTEFVSSYASNNGFAETVHGALNKPYKRQFIKVWNYIKGKISSVLGLTKDNYGGTADSATKLKPFASWNRPYVYDETNGVRAYVYKITMPNSFNSILVQIYDDINFVRCRRYILGLWHSPNYGYNVSVTDLGGTWNDELKVWMGTDGNVYLQANIYWVSRITFSYLDDLTNVTVTKIGVAKYGSNKDVDGTVLFTPLADPITDCGALRADHILSAALKEPVYLKADVFTGDVTGNVIKPSKALNLNAVSTRTEKYIKLGSFRCNDNISFRCRLYGNCFEDVVNINILNGNSNIANVCGYYSTNSGLTNAIIVKRGDSWNSNIEIYLQVTQLTDLTIKVTVDKEYQKRINLSESTTAPSGKLETLTFNNSNGMFSNDINTNCLTISGANNTSSGYGNSPLSIGFPSGTGDGQSLSFDRNSIQANVNDAANVLYLNYYGGIVSVNEQSRSDGGLKVKNKLVIPIGAPSTLEDGCIWIER